MIEHYYAVTVAEYILALMKCLLVLSVLLIILMIRSKYE
jgi:hypothetical protein